MLEREVSSMFPKRSDRGFTLIEVIIAVALVAVMAAVIYPPMIRNLREGKTTRCKSDAQTIGLAIMEFYRDVGAWPVAESADPVDRLVGNDRLGGGNAGIARGSQSVPGSDQWAISGTPSTLSAHLIRNRSAAVDTLWRITDNPAEAPGWHGPYLNSVPLDPWGRPYVINIRYGQAAVTGTLSENYDRHNMMVLSAGPNGLFETILSNADFDESIGGDDIGFVFHGAQRR